VKCQPSTIPLFLIIIFGLCVASVAVVWLLDQGSSNNILDKNKDEFDAFLENRAGQEDLVSNSSKLNNNPTDDQIETYNTLRTKPYSDKEKIMSTFLVASICGKVKDEDGNPITDAEIHLISSIPESIQSIVPMGDFMDSTVSNSGGQFRFTTPAEGYFLIKALKTGFAPYHLDQVLPGDDLDITMNKGVELTGQVMESKTEILLEGAWVRVSDRNFSSLSTTDKTGAFSFSNLSHGKVDIDVFCKNYDIYRTSSLYIKKEEENFIKVELKEGADIEGVVLDFATEKPIANAKVSYVVGFKENNDIREIFREEQATDTQGVFRFEKLSRKGYRLHVQADGYSSVTRNPVNRKGKPEFSIKVILKKDGALSGRVFDPDGLPLKSAEIRVTQKDLFEKKEITCKSDDSGFFLLSPIAAGNISVLASHSDFSPVVINKIALEPGETVEKIEIYLAQSSTIKGLVIGSDKSPIKGARIVLDGIKPILSKKFDIYPLAYSGSDGSFQIKNIPEGEYTIAASFDNKRSPAIDITLQPEEEFEITICLDNGLSITGSVYDCFGEPLDDVLITSYAYDPNIPAERPSNIKKSLKKRINGMGKKERKKIVSRNLPRWNEFGLREPTRYRGSSRSSEDGTFVLNGFLQEDAAVLKFSKYGFNQKVIEDIDPSSKKLIVELNPMCQIEGRIIESSTLLPITSFSVSINKPDKSPLKAKSFKTNSRKHLFKSDDGAFLVENIIPGIYTIHVEAKHYQVSDPLKLNISPDYPIHYVEILMELSGMLRGRVLSGNNSPIGGVTVTIAPSSSAIKNTNKASSAKKKKGAKNKTKPKPSIALLKGSKKIKTDKQGNFSFKDLKPASYTVYIGNIANPLVKPVPINIRKGKSANKSFIVNDLGSVKFSIIDDSGFSVKSDITLNGGVGQIHRQASTDKLGSLKIDNLPPGKYKVTVKAIGYKSLNKKINVEKFNTTELLMQLNAKVKK